MAAVYLLYYGRSTLRVQVSGAAMDSLEPLLRLPFNPRPLQHIAGINRGAGDSEPANAGNGQPAGQARGQPIIRHGGKLDFERDGNLMMNIHEEFATNLMTN